MAAEWVAGEKCVTAKKKELSDIEKIYEEKRTLKPGDSFGGIELIADAGGKAVTPVMNAPADVSVPGYYLAAAIEAMGNTNFLDDIREHKTEYLFTGLVGQVFGEQSALLAEGKVSVKDAALTVLNAYYKERKLKHSYGLEDNTTEKYKDYDKPITLDDIKNLRVLFTERKSINDFTSEEIAATQKWAYKYFKQMGTKSPFFRAWFGDWRAYDKKAISYIPVNNDKITTSDVARKSAKNFDTDWLIQVNSDGIAETANKQGKWSEAYHSQKDLQTMLKNAILFDTRVVIKPSKRMGKNSAFVHLMYCPIVSNERKGFAKLYITEQYEDTKKYYLTKIESEYLDSKGGKPSLTSSKYSDIHNVADLYSLVKQYDKDFTAGKPVSEYVLNEDGTPKVFYHGTNSGGFDEFDKNKIGSATDEGIWGKGFYFSSHKGTSQNYGKNIMQVYLALKNPLVIEDNSTDISELADKLDMWEGNFRKYGENIRISQSQTGQFVSHLLDNGFDSVIIKHSSDDEIVVFNSEYIKSATDNIGTFDGSTGKIKNSYALSEAENSEYMELAKEPEKNEERLNDLVSKAARKAGYNVKAYHGTSSFGFTKFDLTKMDDKRSIFLTDNPEVARSYGGTSEIRTVESRKKQTNTFAAPVNINGQVGYMGAVVNLHGNHYYVSRIINPDGSAFVFKKEKNRTRIVPGSAQQRVSCRYHKFCLRWQYNISPGQKSREKFLCTE